MKKMWVFGFVLTMILSAEASWTQAAQEPLTLEESIRIALEKNLKLHSATEGVAASEFRKKSVLADFLPRWTGQYNYTEYNNPINIVGTGSSGASSVVSDNSKTFNTTATQPLFTGGLLSSNYRLETLGVDLSKTNVETVKRDIVLQVREAYFNILTAGKFREVAEQAVKQGEAQLEVAKAFYEVGIVAKNDVLQVEVRLANARQTLVRLENNVSLLKASFNTLLRRDINMPVNLVDLLQYTPFTYLLEESFMEALRKRPEIKTADLTVDQAKEQVKIAKSALYPTLSLSGTYNRVSDEYDLSGGTSTGEKWNVQALATFTIFDWGKNYYKVGENKVKVNQAQDTKYQLIDSITLEVKQSYLNVLVAEKSIAVTEKSVEQAEENLRLNEERYKYQVATSTDVLDAVTLLAQARANYFGALGDFNIAKARFDRALGRTYP